MMPIRCRLMLRRCFRHPWQVILNLAGIALGVSVVLAIDLTNASAQRAFQLSSSSIAGDITHQIISNSGYIDETFYRDLRLQFGLRDLMPVIEGEIKTEDGNSFQLLGIDPVALLGKTQAYSTLTSENSFLILLAEADSVFVSRHIMTQLDVSVGDVINVRVNGEPRTLSVAGVLPDGNGIQEQALRSSFISDIATAQQMLGMAGKLSRIDLKLDAIQANKLNDIVRQPLQLIHATTRGNALEQMTSAFRINLTALSLLALVIGAFLIYNTMTISVLQQRDLIATLRTLGLSRKELTVLIMGEALLLASIGIALGYGLGIGLSYYLIKLTSRTLDDLYFIQEVQTVYYNYWSFVKATVLGLGAVLLSSFLPLREALRIAPELTRSRSTLESNTRFKNKIQTLLAVLCAVTAVMILVISERSIVAGFAALFFLIMAFALLSPALLIGLVKLFKPLMQRLLGLLGSIAGRGVLSALSRTQVAVAALAVAISATIGVSIMISSFRYSVEVWLYAYLQADVYISPLQRAPSADIAPGIIEQIKNRPGVTAMATGQWRSLWQGEDLTRLYVTDMDERMFAHYRFKDDDNNRVWRYFQNGDAVIISEPYAWHHRLQSGDEIYLPTPRGDRPFRIAGIYYEYGSNRGVVTMRRNVYNNYWQDRGVRSISLFLDGSQDADAFVERINNDLLLPVNLTARSNRSLRELSLKIFDRTFAITEVLRLLTVIIAGIGVLGALMAILLERGREFAMLRANGLTPWELRKLVLSESGLMGVIAGVIAIPLGVVLAAVLIYVINRRSFGWSMDLILEPEYLLSAVLLGLVAGLLAGIYPAWRMAAIPPAAGLRSE